MKLPALLLRFLPLWSYICPRCRREVKRNSHKCPYCGEKYGKPLKVPPLFLKNQKALEEYVHKHIFPRISAKQREYLAQFFTEIFSDGFEDEDDTFTTNWTGKVEGSGTSASVVTSPVHHGSKAAKLYTPTGDVRVYVYKDLPSTYSTLYFRCYVQFDTLPTSGNRIAFMWVYDKDLYSYRVRVYVYNTGSTCEWQIRVPDDSGTSHYATSSGANIQTDTWYCVEVKVVGDSANGEGRLWVDGTEVCSVTGLNNDFNHGNLDRVAIVNWGYQIENNNYFDCCVVADTYIGEEGGVTEVQISDYASGNETLSRPYRGLSLIDQASGQDIFSRPYREIPISELTLGQELLLKTRSLSLSDIATSLEVIQKGRQLGAITDVAQGLEQILKQRLISLLDQAAGFESIARPTRVIVMADEALGREILSKLREVAAIADSAIGVEYVNVGTEGAKKTKIFLLIGDLAIQVTGD